MFLVANYYSLVYLRFEVVVYDVSEVRSQDVEIAGEVGSQASRVPPKKHRPATQERVFR